MGFSFFEGVVCLAVALLLFSPAEVIRGAESAGRYAAKLRRWVEQFKDDLRDGEDGPDRKPPYDGGPPYT